MEQGAGALSRESPLLSVIDRILKNQIPLTATIRTGLTEEKIVVWIVQTLVLRNMEMEKCD